VNVLKQSQWSDKDEAYVDVDFPLAVGSGVTYNIGGDSYPLTVRKVSTTGATVWCSHDDFRGAPGNTLEESNKKGLFIPQDANDPSKWEKFTRRPDGKYRPSGSKCGYLSPDRRYRSDPSF
jgi:hypothetical protein